MQEAHATINRMLLTSADVRESMIRDQIMARGVRDVAVCNALRAVPRELFVPEGFRAEAYEDRALPIGPLQTISQPFIVAYMTTQLAVEPHHRVLEVGTGTGYQAAVLSHLAQTVDTIEHDAALSEQARSRLAKLDMKNVTFHVGDGSMGVPEASLFDRILITAACPQFPTVLIEQLVEGGVLLAPVGAADTQTLVRVTRRPGGWREQWLIGCRFVKLFGRFGWND